MILLAQALHYIQQQLTHCCTCNLSVSTRFLHCKSILLASLLLHIHAHREERLRRLRKRQLTSTSSVTEGGSSSESAWGLGLLPSHLLHRLPKLLVHLPPVSSACRRVLCARWSAHTCATISTIKTDTTKKTNFQHCTMERRPTMTHHNHNNHHHNLDHNHRRRLRQPQPA